MSDNLASALCYIPLLGGLVFFLLSPYNGVKRIRFNACQALLLFGVYLVTSWTVSLFAIGLDMGYSLGWILQLAFLATSLLCGFKAMNGQDVEIPVLGAYARKQV